MIKAIINDRSIDCSSIDDKIERLAKEWLDHLNNYPNSIFKELHFSHLQIIGIGPEALPNLLARIQKGETHWKFAVEAIMGKEME